MKNPLYKRIPRELKSDWLKYLIMLIFLAGVIALVSGFLVVDHSVVQEYNDSFTKYHVEDGHFISDTELTDDTLQDIEDLTLEDKDGNEFSVTVEADFYKEYAETQGATLRIFKNRPDINGISLLEGSMPKQDDEICVDRCYAETIDLEIGDTQTIHGKDYTVSGYVAFSDYSSLFEKNSDMMFDAEHFSVAVMTDQAFDDLGDAHTKYEYDWVYNQEPEDDKQEKEISDDFSKQLMSIVMLTDYVPRYANQAISFAGEDMGSDGFSFTIFFYLMMALLAFVYAIMASSEVEQESGSIGTLRAMGYTPFEMLRHYLILPCITTFLAAIIGNIAGFTILIPYYRNLYDTNYSLTAFVMHVKVSDMIQTTVMPVVVMLLIHALVLALRLRYRPLQFLRHELRKKAKKRAMILNKKLPFTLRFGIRIITRNITGYFTMIIGVLIASIIIVFGFMWTPLLNDYSSIIKDNMICEHQYVLSYPVETENADAEKYCMSSLKYNKDGYKEDEVSAIGVEDDSQYVTADLEENKVALSSSMAKKYGLEVGDTIKLNATYTDDAYTFTIGSIYDYEAGLAVFMPIETYRDVFDTDADAYTGYFSNVELEDLDEDAVLSVIELDDMTKVANQMEKSMGDFMGLFVWFGIIVFVLMVYLLSKQIIQRNANSISMTKILGYSTTEITKLYMISTAIVVVFALILSIPFCKGIMNLIFNYYIYTELAGYIPCNIADSVYGKMFVIGLASFVVIAVLQMFRLSKIPKALALKERE